MPTKYFDGQNLKALPLTDAAPWIDAGFGDWFAGQDGAKVTAESSYSLNGWLRRCVDVRAAAISALPWALFRGDEQLVESDDPEWDGLPWLPTLSAMIALTEASMAIVSTGYWFKVQNRARGVNELRWFAPNTMTPVWDKKAGLVRFDRKLGNDTIHIAPEEVVYFNIPNPLHETEPAASPVRSALQDVGVLHAYGAFAQSYFQRGAIKATLLTVEGNPPPAEKERLKSWWQRAFGGLSQAFNTEVVSAAVTPVVVGEGISELSNMQLSTEKREAISTALGVPHSLVMSNAANFATAEADRLTFYDMTILPSARNIEQAMNKQLFAPLGYRLRFQPEAMSIYQENEEQRAGALAQYVNAGFPLAVAAQILGISLPEGMEYEDLEPEPIIVEPPTQEPEDEADDMDDAPDDAQATQKRQAAWEREAGQFRKWVTRNNGRRQRVDEFKATILTDADKYAIVDELTEDAGSEDNPFPVTLPKVGSITPEWLKAMTLQLDPNDDEAEQLARMAIERRTERQLRRSLEEWLDDVLVGLSEDEVSQIAYLLRNKQMRFRDVLQRALVDSSDLGVSVAINQLETIGYGFDYTLANAEAREWARRYTDDVLRQLNTTNDRIVGEAVARWVDNGEPLDSLVADLRPYFGQTRAQRIAATEVTRAYAEANAIAYQQSGVVDSIEWRTSNDERVCPVCGPMQGKTTPVGGRFEDGMFPPAHPNCRCWVVPVVGTVDDVGEGRLIQNEVSEPPKFDRTEDAKQWVLDTYGIDADYDQFTPDQANAINRGVWQSDQKYKNRIEAIRISYDEKIVARGQSLGEKGITINPNNFNNETLKRSKFNVEKENKRLSRLKRKINQDFYTDEQKQFILSQIQEVEKNIQNGVDFLYADDLSEIIVHEIGHTIETDLIAGDITNINDFLPPSRLREMGINFDDTLQSKMGTIAKNEGLRLSEYATSNSAEYFAEAWTAYTRGEESKINISLIDVFRKIYAQ